MKSLTEIGHQLRSFAKEQQLTQEVTQLETRLKSLKYELELAQDKVKKSGTEQTQITKQFKKIDTEKTKLKAEVDKRAKKIDELKNTINEVEDDIFKKFSKEVGIENVREYESASINRSKEESEAKIRFSSQRSRIEHLLEYENGRDLKKSLKDQQDKVAAERKNLKTKQVCLLNLFFSFFLIFK